MKRRFRREQLNIKSGAGNGYMSSGRHGCKLGKKGFSLPELFIVVALMGILAVITMTGIIVFAKDLKLMEMDGTAKQIFVAAQNHLTRMEASGLLAGYEEDAEKDGAAGDAGKAALGTVMIDATDKPGDFDAAFGGLDWTTATTDGSHAFYRVGHNSGTSSSDNLEGSILEDMLPFGAIDDTVRSGGSYYIEYDLKTAQIYAVFYTDSADGLTELEVKQLSHSGRSDDNTGMEARKSLLTTTDGGRKTVGYYGGAAAQNLETVKLLEPKIIVENGEKLQIKIQDFNYFVGDGFGNNIESRLEVTVTGVDSGKSKTFNMAIGNTPNSDGFYPYSTEANNTWLWKAVNIPAITAGGVTVPEHMEYILTLDDISKTGTTNASGIYEGTHFADIFPEMIPGENIRIEAKITSNNVLCSAVTAQAMTNSLFADANHIMAADKVTDTGKLAVKVSAVRHLENLNPWLSDVSDKVETVDVADNISWNDYVNANKSSDGKTYVYAYKKGTDSVGQECSEDSFYPIENLKLKTFRGNRFVISDFVIDKSNIKARDGLEATGLFSRIGQAGLGQTSIIIDGVTLQNFDVKGNGCTYAGALVGLINSGCTDAQINGVLVMKGTNSGDKSIVTGAKNCGGIIGYSNVNGSGTGDGLKVTNCAVVGTLVGINGSSTADYAGGVIGLLGGRYANIRNSYASGMTSGGKYLTNSEDCNVRATGYAGGLIGYVYSPSAGSEEKYHSVTDSFSTCSVAGNDGGGGLVGSDMNKKTDYKRCYSAGPVVNVTSSGLYGGFAGRIDATTLDNCSYNKNFYTSDSGIKAVGSGDASNAIQGKTTEELKVTGTCKTQVYDTTLNGKTYPYRPVNTTGIVLTDASGSPFTYTGMYYGDWEEPADVKVDEDIPDKPVEPETPEIEDLPAAVQDGYVYAYREKIEGQDGWYWYILTAKGTVESDPIDYLSHANGVKVLDGWEYGFLLKDSKFNSKFKGGNHPYADAETVSLIDKTTGEKGTYYFYKYIGTYDSEGFAVSPNLKWSSKSYNIVFNKNFSCAMALVPSQNSSTATIANAKKLYVGERNPYHIRREDQLRKITGDYFPTKKYIQDCGFTVAGSLPVNIGTDFGGSYDATYGKNANKRYNIVYTGTADKLFQNVSTGASVKAQINNKKVDQP